MKFGNLCSAQFEKMTVFDIVQLKTLNCADALYEAWEYLYLVLSLLVIINLIINNRKPSDRLNCLTLNKTDGSHTLSTELRLGKILAVVFIKFL